MAVTTSALQIEHQFQIFHKQNPLVYQALVEHAMALRAAGVTRYSIGALFEVIRYNAYLDTEDPSSPWKLNNSFRSLYARKLMAEFPELRDFFRTRERRSKRRVIFCPDPITPEPALS